MNYIEEVWDTASRIANYPKDLWDHSEYGRVEVPADLVQKLWWMTRCGLDSTKTGIKRSWTFQEALIFEVMTS